MAQCKETAREFIQDVFCPMVAVLCSSDVETVCQKNGLSFVELIQPFCRLTSEAHIRDPSNVSHPIRNLHIVVHDMNNHPPQNVLARKLLNDVVSNSLPQHSADMMPNNVVTMGNHDLQLDATTPWFEAYRTAFLQIAYPSDHEFLRHYLACIFVVSSSNADPIEQFVKLTLQQNVQQHQQPHKLPKWFMSNILRYYVLIHDVAEQEEAKVETIYQNLKTKYGVQACHLLHINSRSPSASNAGSNDTINMPNPWSRFITQKQEMSESAEFESFLHPGEEEADEFPVHVIEGSLPSVSTDVDLALEAVEEDNSTTSSHVIFHPLEPDTGVIYDPLLSDTDSAVSVSSQSANHTVTKLPSGSNAVDQGTTKAVRSVPLGACLTLSDHDRLRIFINEFIVRGLVFWAEKTIRTLNEQLTTRKGLHRSFFSATKKWFGGNKQTNPAIITNSTNVVYTPDAPEMQMRRLADLAFMFQLYELAYQIYHSAKKDFNNDHAWLHYAGAMEMACLSIFMQDSVNQRQYPLHYMETTITTYLAACKVPHFATRATLLSTEVLKAKGLFAEAALQFIKMTSEESDLRSALLLEQAAHCFVKMKPPMVRKYAFHMILAGHRFNKSGQKRHALRSYAQALQVYKGRYWMIAEDHINYTIGCQSFNLKQFDIAKSAFKHLLTANSQQSLPQQTAFLREYLSVFKLANQTQLDEIRELPELPLPVVEFNTTKILCVSEPERMQSDNSGLRIPATGVSFDTSDGENARFARLEEVILSKGISSLPSRDPPSFKPTIQCYTHTTNNAASPVVAVEEPVTVEVTVSNPLKVTLVLREVELLWRFIPDEDTNAQKFFSNEVDFGKSKSDDSVIHSSPLSEVLLEGSDIKKIRLSLVIHSKGQLQITGLGYYIGCMSALGHVLTSVVPDGVASAPGSQVLPFNGTNPSALPGPVLVSGKVCLEVQGPRLNSTKEERLAMVYGPDRRLNLVITNKMPKLEVFFHDFPSSLFAGQMCQVFVELVNAGHQPLHNVRVTTSCPEFFTFSASLGNKRTSPDKEPTNPEKQTNSTDVLDGDYSSQIVSKPDVTLVTDLGVTIPMEPSSRTRLPMWIRGPDVPGDHVIDFLFYYEPTNAVPFMSHRVVRHTAQLTVYQSLVVRAVCNRMVSPVTNASAGIDCSTYAVYASIEAENICSVPDAPSLSIVQTLSLSQDWTIAEINTSGTMKNVQIGTQECQLCTLQANRYHSPDTSARNLKLSCVPFSSAAVQTNIPQSISTDFFFRASFGEPLKIVQVASHQFGQPVVGSNAEQSLTEKLEKAVVFDLNLIIQWQAVIKEGSAMRVVAVGQHHMTINRLNAVVTSPPVAKLPADLPPIKFISSHIPVLTLEPSSELLAQLVRFSFHYRPEVSHDFSQNRVCIVPVVIHLFNCTDVQICVDIDTMAGQTRSSAPASRSQHHQALGSIGQGHPMRPFTWSGVTVTRLHLAPDQGQSIRLKACFVTAGVYDLGTAQVLAFPAVDSSGFPLQPIMQRPLAPSFITIHSQSPSDDEGCSRPS